MAQRENRLEANMDTRIAVIGMSAILPCGTTVRESWEAIRDGIDCLSDLPEDRVDVTAYFDPVKTTKDKIYCKRGGFIPEYDFDAREFGLNMFQMEDSDANQTVTLLKVKEALEDAGIEALSKEKKNIGCVLGIGGGQKSSHEFYSRLNYVVVEKVLRKMGMPEEDVQAAVEKYKANFPEWRLDSFPGFLGNVTAGRCTNTFNLDGMNCVVDAACASSLIAVKVAIDELLHGDCDMMITGATCTDNSIGMYMAFSKTPVFSTDPSVRAYDEKTKGMLIGEGSAMLVLKRYADAVRDGDEIHAVIRGCASSSDGKASGIYTPTISGQEEALRRAYMRANVDPATVTLVEGHGTGTPVGDRIELTALRNLFDSAYGNEKEKVAVGSIKSNIGHLKAVAGLAGMIKVIMALKHKTLPATINVDEPPKLYDNTPITDSSLYINTMNRPWFPAPGVPRRAGISSFGFGGANYHAVLEEAEPEHQKAYRLNKRPQPVLLMASSTQALASLCEAQLKEFEKAIEENKTVKNTAYIKCVDFCEKFKFPGSIPSSNARLGFLVKEADDATETLRAIVAQFQKSAGKDSWHLPRQGVSFRAQGINTTGGVAALFSGQGAQYTHMFSEVAMNWPQFRESISDMDRAQAKVAGADKDYERVSQVLYPRKPYNSEPEQDHKKISLTSYSQPSTLACALGAYEIFKQAGFKPDFAAGHSLGEFAALYAADCVNRDDLFELVCRRARIMGGKDAPATPKGCMAAVIGPNAEKIQIRTADVWLGNCNSPSQTVITGSVEGIKKESELLQSEGFRVVPLACESAFHSPQMQNASSAFKDVLSKVAFRQPSAQTKLFSNVSGETYSNNAQDLLKEHMTSSVKFISQVRNMHSAGARIFVEFGPKQVLSKLVSETLKDDPSIITISVNPSSGKDADIQLREAAVQLVVAGVNLQGFDKWDAPDATRLQPIKKKKTTLRLSAATYVSDKTKKAREAAMNDGRMLSCVSKVIAPPDAKPIVDTKAQEEVARLQKQLQDAQAQIQKAKADAAEADKKLAAAKDEAKRAAASAPVQKQVDTTIVDKHRAILKSMLAELDCYSTPGAVSSSFQAPVAATPAPVAAPVAAAPAPAVNNALLAKAESVVMEVLAAKTGYETDMIEADMELETELGIDSIKRVEILSEVQAMLNVEAKDVDALSRTRTVGEVVNAMKAEIAGSSGAATASAPAAAAAAPAIKISTVHGADCDDLSVMSAELVDIRRADELLLERPENRPVLIVDDGTELTSALVRVLGAGAVVLTFDGLQLAQRAGAAVRHVQVKDLSAESAEKAIKEAEQRFGQLGGFISQQAERFAPADILGFTLMCAKFAKASLCTPVQGGRAFFIGVARLDGRLGFTSQGSTDSLTRAQRGAIFGLCKTIGLEWSANEVFARGIDIAREVHPEDAAVAITREMSCADNRIREVGIGLNQKRCTIRAVDLKPGAPKIQISQDDVLLVSGGARGITPLCIREITRQVRGGKYILLGRSKVPAGEPAWCNGVSDDDLGKAAMQELKRAFSAGEGPKPTPMTHKKLVGTIAGAREVRSSIANIEALGGKAIYSSCDVNSAADVAKAVREAEAQLGARVTGVVHASGVLRDRLIEQKRPDEFDAVFGTKVTGLENLFGAIDMANLKHLVLFSSLAGFHGNIGQSDYAMANEALNKMGLELSDRVSVKSICFGPWDGGMVTPQLKKQFQSMGVQIIPREGGADTVARIVLGSSPAEILVGNWTTPTKKVGSEPVVIHRKISAASNPFLKDHVIQGRCVLPMTIAVGCLAETCLGQFPGYSLWAIEDAQLFKGVTVDGDVNCEITLKPSQGTAGRVMIQATLKTFASGKLVPAYRAVIVLSTQGKPPAATTSQTPSLQADPAARGNPYDGKTLFHGPAFQGLKEIISCNKSQLVAECTFIPSSESAGEFASDYESHNPFVNDIAFQAMLVWIRRTLGQAALPNSIQRIVQHRALPQDKPFYLTLKSNSASGHSQHKTSVQFHNEQGDLFVDIQASVTSSDSLAF